MCFLEKPLLPETFSSLRTFTRKCIEIRSELVNDELNKIRILEFKIIILILIIMFFFKTNVKDEKLNALNLFIAVIGQYFSQLDLAD